MAKKLTNLNGSNKIARGSVLDKQSFYFKFGIEVPLNSKYNFSKLNKSGLKALDNFIKETVGKRLTISEVDKLFLRTKGPVKSIENVYGNKQEIVHYGKSNKPFRIHGYYNDDGYFIMYQIDPKHQKHKV